MWILNLAEKIVFAILPPLKRWPRFVRYSIVGGAAATGDFSLYFILTRFIAWFADYYLVANTFSFILGSLIGYFLNKSWTFEQGGSFIAKQYIKYFIANIITLLFLQFCFYFFVEILHIYDMIGKILLLAISIGINFSFSTFWTFKVKT